MKETNAQHGVLRTGGEKLPSYAPRLFSREGMPQGGMAERILFHTWIEGTAAIAALIWMRASSQLEIFASIKK